MTDTFLSKEELSTLTGRQRARAQAEALNRMGIIHTVRPDGQPLVLRAHLNKKMGAEGADRIQKAAQPNWDAMTR